MACNTNEGALTSSPNNRLISEADDLRVDRTVYALHQVRDATEAIEFIDYLTGDISKFLQIEPEPSRQIALDHMRRLLDKFKDSYPVVIGTKQPEFYSDNFADWYDRRILWHKVCETEIDFDEFAG